MNKNDFKYKMWLKNQNFKALKRRTEKRIDRKAQITKKRKYNEYLKQKPNYHKKLHYFIFKAPQRFSVINNPIESILFFQELLSFVQNKNNYKKTIFIDISGVKYLTIDALMYLISIINNSNNFEIMGNEPDDTEINKAFKESGFYSYVHSVSNIAISQNRDSIQIVSGNDCNTVLAKRIVDFISEIVGCEKRNLSFLYNIMIELMSNTHKHAYTGKTTLHPCWYCFAEYDKNNIIRFTFMDTGKGIPSTVKKKVVEKMLSLYSENDFVVSALNGEFRTATNQKNRGKGLPKIRQICKEGKISNLHIISSKADVKVNTNSYFANDNAVTLRGTVYYWEITISDLKEKISNE